MLRFLVFIFIIVWCPVKLLAQEVTGTVNAPGDVLLPGANLMWLHDGSGASTNAQGEFTLPSPASFPDTLVIYYIGYQNDTNVFLQAPTAPLQISLIEGVALDELEISEKVRATQLSTLTPNLVETIGGKELEKAACCNVSESFETNASVDLAATDAVSGSKKIRMLGLDGVYSSLLLENIPWMTGLQASTAFNKVPGTWVDGIQISKGAGSVVNGYSSLTGQINLQLLAPDEVEERVFINLYCNTMGRGEANVHLNQRFSEKWSSLLLLHASGMQQKNDINDDLFLDAPLRESYQVLNRWKYKG
ncbi:MAG: carboxypeptidase-like regulatory domain-containing protein, partial [Salibacteraceae bacterium]